MGILRSLVDTEYKELKRFRRIADKIVALEDEYSVEIPSEDLEKLLTVGDVVNYLKDKGVE